MERLQGGKELPNASEALMKLMGGVDSVGFIAEEIGGGNGVQPMIAAAETGKTVIDSDLMGRAYPNVSHIPVQLLLHPLTPGPTDVPNVRYRF